jgi:hypothetical protein
MEQDTVPAGSDKQTELLQRYCAEAERELDDAASYAEALRLRDSLCTRFQTECDSPLVVHATRQYLDSLIMNR